MDKVWKNADYIENVAGTFSLAVNNISSYQSLREMGIIDSLTGLLNRNYFERTIENLDKNEYRNVACVYIDANGLHNINNRFGHEAGDNMIKAVAQALQSKFGSDKTYRIGGDEFVAFTFGDSEKQIEENIESIKKYNDGSIHLNVKGLEINDINYRGNFTFKVDDSIDMTWRGEKINISDLKEGDNISITFTDEIINDISPTPLKEVVKVQLLRDDVEKQENEINNKVTTIDIQETGLSSVTPPIKYTLNQEEIYTIFSIIDNLTFSKETCDGIPTYFIKYNSKEKEGFLTYGIEKFENEYHITSDEKGEAILSNEQQKQLDKIINKMYN